MRVRTYGFPGCFTRPPGTSTRHHPHEPTTSKPVVPEDVAALQSSRKSRGRQRRKKRRGPGPLEEPAPVGPKAFLCWWRGLTPQWPRSLRLGSASGFKVARPTRRMQPPREQLLRTFQKKVRAKIAHRAGRPARRALAADSSATWRAIRSLGGAYRCCHNGVMDSGDVSLHPPGPALPGAPLPAPAARPSENPFGEPAAARARAEPAQAHRQRARRRSPRSSPSSSRRSKAGCCCCRNSSCSRPRARRSCRSPPTACSGAGRSRPASSCCCSCTRWAT